MALHLSRQLQRRIHVTERACRRRCPRGDEEGSPSANSVYDVVANQGLGYEPT